MTRARLISLQCLIPSSGVSTTVFTTVGAIIGGAIGFASSTPTTLGSTALPATGVGIAVGTAAGRIAAEVAQNISVKADISDQVFICINGTPKYPNDGSGLLTSQKTVHMNSNTVINETTRGKYISMPPDGMDGPPSIVYAEMNFPLELEWYNNRVLIEIMEKDMFFDDTLATHIITKNDKEGKHQIVCQNEKEQSLYMMEIEILP